MYYETEQLMINLITVTVIAIILTIIFTLEFGYYAAVFIFLAWAVYCFKKVN